MTVVRVSRKKICNAIEREPTATLKGGDWIFGDRDQTIGQAKDCPVCAVGAVMRNALLAPNQSIGGILDAIDSQLSKEYSNLKDGFNYISSTSSPEFALEQGAYMHALSAFFETEAAKRNLYAATGPKRSRGMNKLKKDCIKFVKENFPAFIEIDIDGAKPAKDVKVVKKVKGK